MTSGNLLYDAGSSTQNSVKAWRGEMWWEVGGRSKGEGAFVYWWLIRVGIWQEPTQHCKAIFLQLKINKLKNKYCNIHTKFLCLLWNISLVPKGPKLPWGRKHIISLAFLPVFCLNSFAAKFEWKIIPLPVGNLRVSWPRKLFKQLWNLLRFSELCVWCNTSAPEKHWEACHLPDMLSNMT